MKYGRQAALGALVAAVAGVAACTESAGTGPETGAETSVAGVSGRITWGEPVALGNGQARTYVVKAASGRPLEIGVALDSAALEGLPADGGHGGEHPMPNVLFLPLPEAHGTPYRLMELDWNPGGHEPAGIYDKPHFDFHFYTISDAERNSIDPTDPAFQTKAERLPAPEYIPAGYFTPQPVAAVPYMGVHWLDQNAAELPPRLEPFTTTFITGSWDGQVIFQEPMITREFILSRPDTVIAIPQAQRYAPAGHYPRAYRISWNRQTKQYHIAFTALTPRD